MNKLKLAIWIFALANIAVALAGMCLSLVADNIFSRTFDGSDRILDLTRFYFRYRVLTFAVLAISPSVAALVLTFRRSVTPETVLLFGAGTVLLIALQTLLAVLAVGRPLYILSVTPF